MLCLCIRSAQSDGTRKPITRGQCKATWGIAERYLFMPKLSQATTFRSPVESFNFHQNSMIGSVCTIMAGSALSGVASASADPTPYHIQELRVTTAGEGTIHVLPLQIQKSMRLEASYLDCRGIRG